VQRAFPPGRRITSKATARRRPIAGSDRAGTAVLRGFQVSDLAPLADMNADPAVMPYLGGPISRQASEDTLRRAREHWARHGFGRFAIEDRRTHAFLGWVGLAYGNPVLPDEVEIGWRLAHRYWGAGIATEAAQAVLDWLLAAFELSCVVSIANAENVASIAVMHRLGLHHRADVIFEGEEVTIFEITPNAVRPRSPYQDQRGLSEAKGGQNRVPGATVGLTPEGGKPLWNKDFEGERVTRIELALSAWEADVLPLNYTRERRPAGLSKASGRIAALL
jgi:RimJ/RimL family protein N-acetyltransferase